LRSGSGRFDCSCLPDPDDLLFLFISNSDDGEKDDFLKTGVLDLQEKVSMLIPFFPRRKAAIPN
jgi:hypothetical protein